MTGTKQRAHLAAAPVEAAPAPQTTRTLRPVPHDVASALSLQCSADNLRAVAKAARERGETTVASCREIEAEEMDLAAATFFVPDEPLGPPGIGGELTPTGEVMENAPAVYDTLKTSPDMMNATASRERLSLAAAAGALVQGADIAETIGARNSLERMLAQQLGAIHVAAMKFSEQSALHLALYRLQSDGGRFVGGNLKSVDRQFAQIVQDQQRHYQALLVEASRASNTATRLMTAFQGGLLAFDRLRRGGKQTVKVIHQHVAVAPGAQAVVAGGNVKGGTDRQGNFRAVPAGGGRGRARKRTGGGNAK
jgi:hypothetical protein